MNIMYLGDIMGKPGRVIVAELLPSLIDEYELDFVIAQAENVSHGKGMTPSHMRELQNTGVDFFTGGNHSLEKPNSFNTFNDPAQPVIRPANMLNAEAGSGYKFFTTKKGRVLVVSLLGDTFPVSLPMKNPLKTIDEILDTTKDEEKAAIVINFHGDFSSHKRMIGHYLDGRATLVVGDHWHVPTADASILPKGTAHISDVGMCGSLHSSLGVKYDVTIPRWRDAEPTRNEIAIERPYQLNAVVVNVSEEENKIQQVQRILE